MKKITLILIVLFTQFAFSQVGVNTTTPDPSSMLDISSTNKGVLVPRVSLTNVTTTMLDGTNTAATGLLIWNTNAATVGGNGVGFYFFNGTQWMPITQTITGNTLDQSYDQGGAGVGKNINATDGAVRINGDDGFLVTGTFGTGNTIDTEITGNGARMFFNPRKAAFRAGFAEGTRWNDALIGDYSFAVNRRSQASGFASVSLGYDSEATGDFSFVAGNNSAATGDHSFAFGRNSYTNSSEYSVVFGDSANSYDNFSWAIGQSTNSYGVHSFAKGFNVISRSYGETVFGFYNTDYTANSTTTYNDFDRLFVIGNGINSSNLSNALTIFKDGRMNINDAYTMPTTDGTSGQVMQTNGSGIVSWATPSTGTDDQNLITPTLVGTTLNLNIENGTGTSIDLAPLQDGIGTDNQTLNLVGNNLSISGGNSVNLSSLNTDDQNLVTPSLVGTTLNLNIENGTGTSIDLAPLQDGTGTDNQTLTLAGNNLSISGGNTVNLSSLNTDDQNLVTPTLVGTTLNLNIENGTGTSIDLAPLQDGTGTDDQIIDNFSLSGTTLRLSLENDGLPLQTVNLASLVGTDDQNLVTPTLVGTTLNLNIENGTGTSIDLAPLQDGTGTDDQNIQNLSFNSTTNLLTVGIENGTSQSVSLSSLAGNDVDWYEQGTTNAPNAISDDIYTEGDVDINNGVLSITTPTNSSGGLTITKTISNAGSLTYSSVNNNVTLTGSNNSIMYNNSYTGGGTGGQTLIQNGFFSTGASFLTGMINNFNNNNNSTQSYGIQNNFNITGFGSRVGLENNFSTVNGNATGLYNIITGGIGTLYGTRTQITGGTGTNYGNVVSMTGGSATRYGFLADITGTGAGIEYGIRTNVEDVTNGYAAYFQGRTSLGQGTTNRYLMPGTDGTAGQVIMTDGSGNLSFQDVSGSDADWLEYPTNTTPDNINDNMYHLGRTAIGINDNTDGFNLYRLKIDTGTGDYGGLYIENDQGGSGISVLNSGSYSVGGVVTGLNLRDESIGTRNKINIYNSLAGSGAGMTAQRNWFISFSNYDTEIGVRNDLWGGSNGTKYGTYNDVRGAGLGSKYGSYNIIETTAGGTHYGVYSEALKSNSYAGYFLGNVSIGTTTGNNYVFPATRGTNGQIMQTDAFGNLSWTTPSISESTTASNGLTEVGNDVRLGGSLALPTTISQGNFNLSFASSGTGEVLISNTGATSDALNVTKTDNTASIINAVNITKTGNGTGAGVGINLSMNGVGSGNITGYASSILNTGTGIKYAFDSNFSSTGSGTLYGLRNQFFNSGGGIKYGTYNNFSSISSGTSFGIYNIFNQSTGNYYGVSNQMTGSTNSAAFAIDNTLSGTGSGAKTGVNNNFSGTTINTVNPYVGMSNTFSDSGGGQRKGLSNNFQNTGNGTTFGVENVLQGSNNSIHYGVHNSLTGIGSGNKYGTYNFIGNTSGGTHYGTYNEVSATNGWAGYFVGRNYISDRLSIGELNNSNALLNISGISDGTISHIELEQSTANTGARIRFKNATEISNEWVLFSRTDDTPADSRFNVFHSGGTGNIMVVTGDGKVGIMRTPTTNDFEVNGNASKATAGSWLANSDKRLKKNITTIDPQEALNKIIRLRGVNYEWDDNSTNINRPKGYQMGFIAQEIAEVFPEKVTEDNLGYLQTAYGDYDPIVFQAIKALNDKIENLEKENAALKSIVEKVNALEAKLEQMNIK